jgi:hypothetical protein
MAENKFKISDIFRNQFGYEAPQKFVVPDATAKPTQSSLGQPYYKEDLYGREFFLPITLDGIVLPFAVVGVSEKKTFVETPMVEREGTVTEMISADDVVFSIKGIILDEDGNFPEADIIKLRSIYKKNQSVELRSALTDIFLNGIYGHRVIIKNLDWPESAGIEHAKPFSMQLKSDQIFELKIS